MKKNYQVVIVGGGPVGAALAVGLGMRGISCALIERRRTLQNIPKGQNLTQRTLEHFHFWGIADELRAARTMPPGYPIGEVTAYGDLMSEYWFASAGREVVRPYYYQDNDRLPQYRTEEVLRRKMASLPGVDDYFGWMARVGDAGRDRRGGRHRAGRDVGATHVARRLRRRLRRRQFDGARPGGHPARRHRFRPGDDAGRLPLARTA